MNNCTLLYSIIWSLVFTLSSLLSDVHAQVINTLSIESSNGTIHEFELFHTNFGPRLIVEHNDSIQFAVDQNLDLVESCEQLQASFHKTIIVYPLDCTPFQQAINVQAQTQKTASIIFCTDFTRDLRHSDYLCTPEDVDIPTYSLSMPACDSLRILINNQTIEARFDSRCITPYYGDHVIWGNIEGQGDFNGGLNDWIIECEGDSCWQWSSDGFASGSFTNHTALTSTACNGVALFNEDGLNPPFPSLNYCGSPCAGSLISPNITVPEIEPDYSLALRFDQSYRQFNSCYYILISTDDGQSWPDSILINEHAELNGPSIDQELTIHLEDYEDVTQIKFKFYLHSNYYFWSIDDVRVIKTSRRADCMVNHEVFAAPTIYSTPLGQSIYFPLGIELQNIGLATAKNVTLDYAIYDESDDKILDQQKKLDSIEVNGIIDIEDTFMLLDTILPIGNYRGVYRVSSQDDRYLTNNEWCTHFKVTPDQYTHYELKDDYAYERSFPSVQEADTWSSPSYRIGEIFHVSDGGFYLDSVIVKFSDLINNASGGINLKVYELSSGLNQDSIHLNQQLLVGEHHKVLDTLQDRTYGNFPFDSPLHFGSNPVYLNANTDYLIMLEAMSITSFPIPVSVIEYSADNKAVEKLNRNWLLEQTINLMPLAPEPKVIGAFMNQEDYDGSWGSLGPLTCSFLPGIVPIMEVIIKPYVSINTELSSAENIKIFPNPSSDILNLEINDSISDDSGIQILDAVGINVLSSILRSNKQTKELDVSILPVGIYFLCIETKEEQNCQKFVISR